MVCTIIKKGSTTPDTESRKPIRIKLQGRMFIYRKASTLQGDQALAQSPVVP